MRRDIILFVVAVLIVMSSSANAIGIDESSLERLIPLLQELPFTKDEFYVNYFMNLDYEFLAGLINETTKELTGVTNTSWYVNDFCSVHVLWNQQSGKLYYAAVIIDIESLNALSDEWIDIGFKEYLNAVARTVHIFLPELNEDEATSILMALDYNTVSKNITGESLTKNEYKFTLTNSGFALILYITKPK